MLALAACIDHQDNLAGGPPGTSPPGGTGTPSALAATSDGTTAVADWQAGEVPLGAKATTTVFFTNVGEQPTKPLQLALGGTNASEFAVDAASSTCSSAELAPGTQCHVGLVFAPTGSTPGARTAQLDVLGAANGFALALAGTATPAPTGGITVDMTALDLGPTQLGKHSIGNVVATNTGTASVALAAPRVTGDSSFGVAGFDCGTSLAPGASCTISVQFSPVRPGAVPGTLLIGGAAVKLAGIGERQIVVTVTGPGAVSATPNNLTCDQTSCSGLFPGDVVLTATPGAGASFAGWSPLCDANPTCTLPRDNSPQVVVHASFTTSTIAHVTITMPGPAPGAVFFAELEGTDRLPVCTHTCTVAVTPGSHLTVSGYTPSTFAGWTAPGCTDPTSHDCDLGAITHDVAVSVSFQRDERELTTIIPRAIVTGLVFAPDGDLIVADHLGVSKLGLDGAVVWTVALASGARDLATDSAGHIYGASNTGAGVFALAADGTALWTRTDLTASATTLGVGAYQNTVVASLDGSVIAVKVSGKVQVLDGAGHDRFTTSGPSSGLAVGADNSIGVGVDAGGFLALARFDASGNPLDGLPSLPGNTSAALAFDAGGNLGAYIGGFGSETLSLNPPTGNPAFVKVAHTSEGDPIATAVAFDGATNVIGARGLFADHQGSGLHIDLVSRTGTTLWSHDKTGAIDLFNALNCDLVTPAALATHGQLVAFGGAWGAFGFSPWIQVYTMPAGQ
ncbi:MAG TPA: choice-of-anchor D domain-containing protein [Kofleriaceae bacterium]|nr:choice-of-anchor D domain-containing protein [Kofleriaceae bacterium]